MAPTWFWAHDIAPGQLDSLATPGMRLVRLAGYGTGPTRRWAALLHGSTGADRTYRLDLTAEELRADPGGAPVALTVHDGPEPRFSVVLDHDAGSRTSVRVGLDEAGARDLPGVVDVASYLVDGVRRYAVVLDPTAGAGRLLTSVTEERLRAELRRLRATPVRLRAETGAGRTLFTAVVEPAGDGSWYWYPDLTADEVARRLDRHRAYPVDLDATRDGDRVRFTVVMRR